MKQISKLTTIIVVALLMISINETSAQNRRQGPPAAPDSTQIIEMVDNLAKELSLTDVQKEKIKELHLSQLEEMKTNRQNGENDRQKMREEMEESRKELQEKVMQILNDEQKEKYTELMEKRLNQRPQRSQRPQRQR
ncbi:Spy/CpxP family protein refolding chaperone [Thermophagus sp. OGC60D27]|uniref:Spy/CpxP family protein refolding chaperone n=1 Tax=Thermophagus sp. OGC60D27 TaxID=3458415 RepID=UPI0040383BC3